MNTQLFSTGTEFRWLNVLYEVKQLLPGQMVNIESVATRAMQVLPIQMLIDAWTDGTLAFSDVGKHTLTDAQANALPLERIEIDHTQIDLIVMDEEANILSERLTITVVVDTVTRQVVASHL